MMLTKENEIEEKPKKSEKIKTFAKKNAVFLVAFTLALVTSFIVPPDKEYLGYFDFKTLSCILATLAVVCALKNIRFFTKIAQKIVMVSGNTRAAVIMLVIITFVGSMLIANDMALLTFLPLGYYVLYSTEKDRYMAFTFIMQNIAANLGGMITPFGNPQNLYIYEKFKVPNGEFMLIMLFPFLLSISAIIIVCALFVKPEKLVIEARDYKPLPKGKTLIYLLLFALSILLVFRVVPYYIGLVTVFILIAILDFDALKKVDYCLILTFCSFFVFSGNMARIPAIRDFFSSVLEKDPLIISASLCQFISNVPTTILLSNFTNNYRALLIGVNIGGAGTLIASLASLITFREYTSHYREKTGKYVLLFSIINFSFLIALAIFGEIVLKTNNFCIGY